MTQFYYDPARENDAYSLPDAEVFYRTRKENKEYDCVDGDGDPMPAGWYFWTCLPGCLPDSDPFGPYESEQKAIEAAQDMAAD